MTFKKFEEIFKTRFPEGEVFSHGDFAGTEKNMKTTAVFAPGGKVYSYYGAYDIVLQKMGIKCVSKEHLAEEMLRLKDLRDRDGKPDMFFGGMVDNSAEIERLEARIAEINRDFIIA